MTPPPEKSRTWQLFVAPFFLTALVLFFPILFLLHAIGIAMASRRSFVAEANDERLILRSRRTSLSFSWPEVVGAEAELSPPALAVRVITSSGQSPRLWVRNLAHLEGLLRERHVPLRGLWPSARLSKLA